jgi:large conductance mechanosensitive channel
MSIIQEFKSFAIKGNVVDLAVGIIIGGAFQKIVSSTVQDIIMPPIGFMIGGVKFTDLKFTIGGIIDGMTPVTINYGNFIQTVFDFVIVAFAIFMLVKGINRLKEKMEQKAISENAEAPVAEDILLLREIRDALAKKNIST